MKAPDGTPIVATVDLIPGLAMGLWVSDEFHYVGETEVCWDNQEVTTLGGQDVFEDENGNQWLECQLIPDDAEPLENIQPWYTNHDLRRIEIENTMRDLFYKVTGRVINLNDRSRFDSTLMREAIRHVQSAVEVER